MNSNLIKVILAILFFLCLLDMPYGYYQLVRFAALIGFAYLAYKTNEEDNKTEAIVYVVLAILIQPFVKIALGRTIWNIIDVIIGIALIGSIIINKNKKA